MRDLELAELFTDTKKTLPVYEEVKTPMDMEGMVARVRNGENRIKEIKDFNEAVNARAQVLIEYEKNKINLAKIALEPYGTKIINKNRELDKKASKKIKCFAGEIGLRMGKDKINNEDNKFQGIADKNIVEQAEKLGIP